MIREYTVVGKLRGREAERLMQALDVGAAIEFEKQGDEMIIKVVSRVIPDCQIPSRQPVKLNWRN